jgi:integrase
MATLTIDRGTYRIQWIHNLKRLSISLSRRKYSKKTANDLRDIIQELIYYKDNSIEIHSKRTKTWIETTTPQIRKKLEKVGLIKSNLITTCGYLWDQFLAAKTEIKPSTMTNYEMIRKRFFAYFDESTPIINITTAKIEQWKISMQQNNSATASIAGTLAKTSTVFKWAARMQWIPNNPLTGVKHGGYINHKKAEFVTIEEYEKYMQLTTNQDWRLLLTLARIGGIRCPSEAVNLTWDDIDWKNNRFYINSSKTERFKGHEGRIPPLFPRLKVELLKYQKETNHTTGYIFNRTKDALHQFYTRIFEINGIKMERPFNNMRASRSTEIFSKFGEYLESKWIGHSTKIACKHYLVVREEDYKQAIDLENFD